MLDLAARLALRGVGRVEPNPAVGAVIVRDGTILGMGHHRRFGGPHAEREALDDCRRRGLDPAGATLYSTLEPCVHHGKQPPCVDAIVHARIARVVFARRDPNPLAAGGAEALRRAGVGADIALPSPLATGVGAPFAKRITTGLPWVIAKWAQTVDGRIATRTGESKWISSDRSRRRVHRLRARVDAILTGIGTVLADDPSLTARDVPVRRVAARVVADADLDLPATCRIVRTASTTPTFVACAQELVGAGIVAERETALRSAGVRVLGVPMHASGRGIDLRALLRTLAADHGVCGVLVEAGPGIVGSLLEHDLVDEAVVYIAPLMLGDEFARAAAAGRVADSLSAAKRFDLWRSKALGSDVELTYRARASARASGAGNSAALRHEPR